METRRRTRASTRSSVGSLQSLSSVTHTPLPAVERSDESTEPGRGCPGDVPKPAAMPAVAKERIIPAPWPTELGRLNERKISTILSTVLDAFAALAPMAFIGESRNDRTPNIAKTERPNVGDSRCEVAQYNYRRE